LGTSVNLSYFNHENAQAEKTAWAGELAQVKSAALYYPELHSITVIVTTILAIVTKIEITPMIVLRFNARVNSSFDMLSSCKRRGHV
jgi:hypothetical protein